MTLDIAIINGKLLETFQKMDFPEFTCVPLKENDLNQLPFTLV